MVSVFAAARTVLHVISGPVAGARLDWAALAGGPDELRGKRALETINRTGTRERGIEP